MRTLAKIVCSCLIVLILMAAGILYWFYYYSADLPDIRGLARFSPATAGQVSDPCLNQVEVIPRDLIGNNFLKALNTVEDRLPTQISRSMFCTPSKLLRRRISELRTSVQIARIFPRSEILTIYANRAYFGPQIIGIEAAAHHFFEKEPSDMDVAEAALLAGLIRSPTLYSPFRHPDRALRRRNEVVDAMVVNGSITSDEAQRAKSEPLNVVTR